MNSKCSHRTGLGCLPGYWLENRQRQVRLLPVDSNHENVSNPLIKPTWTGWLDNKYCIGHKQCCAKYTKRAIRWILFRTKSRSKLASFYLFSRFKGSLTL